jgi:SOS-response transcriptional repressor LexA
MALGAVIRRRREELALTQDQVAEQAGISKPYLSNIETGRPKNPPTDGVLAALERALKFAPGELTEMAHLARTPADVRQSHEMLQAEVHKLRAVLTQLAAGAGGAAAPSAPGGGVDLDEIARRLRGEQPNVRVIEAGRPVPIINKVAAGYPHHFTDLDYPVSVADEYIRCPDVHDAQAFGARVVGDSMEPEYRQGDIVIFSPNTPARAGNDCFVRFDDCQTTFKRFYMDEQAIRLQPLNSKYPSRSYSPQQVTGLWPAVFRIQKVGA